MAAPRLMTTQQYLMTEETLRPQELIFGTLRVADAPKPRHQQLVAELFVPMALHVRQGRLGTMWLSPLDVVLDDEKGLVCSPTCSSSAARPAAVRARPHPVGAGSDGGGAVTVDAAGERSGGASGLVRGVWGERVLAGASVPVEDGGRALRERQDCGASVVWLRRAVAFVGAARFQAGALRSARQQPRDARQLRPGFVERARARVGWLPVSALCWSRGRRLPILPPVQTGGGE